MEADVGAGMMGPGFSWELRSQLQEAEKRAEMPAQYLELEKLAGSLEAYKRDPNSTADIDKKYKILTYANVDGYSMDIQLRGTDNEEAATTIKTADGKSVDIVGRVWIAKDKNPDGTGDAIRYLLDKDGNFYMNSYKRHEKNDTDKTTDWSEGTKLVKLTEEQSKALMESVAQTAKDANIQSA